MLLQPRHLRAFLLLALCLSLAGGWVRCSRQPEERAEIRIGVLVDLGSPSDEATVHSARLAAATVNDAGGLDVGGKKHHIVLISEEIKPTPAEVVDAARRVIHRQNVVAVVGPNQSQEAILVAGVAENARVPMISPKSTNPRTTDGREFAFRVAFTDAFQGEVMARFAIEELGTSTAAVLYDVANAYNRDIAAVFKEVFEAAGGQVVAFESYVTGDQDFTRQLLHIRNRGPGALFLPNYSTDVVAQASRIRELGIDTIILGSDGWTPGETTAHPELEGAFFSQHWHPDLADANAQARAFVEAYRRTYDQDPSSMAALTYDAFGLLFQAIGSAGRADPEGIRQALSRMENYRGVAGSITYRGTGGDPEKGGVVLQIVQGKTVVYRKIAGGPR
ncbi:MAG: ABC transporter substrate-binding protein [bacterium]|nr:ABC transporter substrate-binding protein [bacterium]